ncbi:MULTISPECIES: (deoxy)nucleoside triphosphate pyrophosphohydrolase [unclassified Microbacterium]|uniref:(deoxy)nucleoside triphosphate pyrophosphohydrolase n=1 Tax=unclassified Microbacterium TaxID=2609290 RepID=UPI0030189AED
MSQSRIIEVVAAVVEREALILTCRRRAEKAAGGKWEFPGGKVEPGETHADALVREIQEELGASIEITGMLRTDDTAVGEEVIRLTCFRARLLGEPPTESLDHDELRWIGARELPNLEWATPDLPAVRELARTAATR